MQEKFSPILGFVLVFCLFALVGCGSSTEGQPEFRGIERAEREARPTRGATEREARPAALINGAGISWDTLHPALAETSGAVALEEVALGMLVDEELRRRGLTLTPELIERERALFRDMLGGDEDEAVRLEAEVRRVRRLGEWRYQAMLERNAGLRLCVKDLVTITPEMIEQRHAIRHGPKVIARVITTPTEIEASRIASQLRAAGERLEIEFVDLAMAHSTDESRSRGGLLEPISPADPTYETAVRLALGRIHVGQISGVVALDQGFAVFYAREAIASDGVEITAVRDRIEAELRARQERVLMDDLARRLIAGATISPLDRSLQWSWRLPTGVGGVEGLGDTVGGGP